MTNGHGHHCRGVLRSILVFGVQRRFQYAVPKKIALRSTNSLRTNTRSRSSTHVISIMKRIRNRYAPSNAVPSLGVDGRENQHASSAEIAFGAKKMVQSGQKTSSQAFSHAS